MNRSVLFIFLIVLAIGLAYQYERWVPLPAHQQFFKGMTPVGSELATADSTQAEAEQLSSPRTLSPEDSLRLTPLLQELDSLAQVYTLFPRNQDAYTRFNHLYDSLLENDPLFLPLKSTDTLKMP